MGPVPQKALELSRGRSAGPSRAFRCSLGTDACNSRSTRIYNQPEIGRLRSRNLPTEIGPDTCPPLQGECRRNLNRCMAEVPSLQRGRGPAPIPWTVFRLRRLMFWVFAYLLHLTP